MAKTILCPPAEKWSEYAHDRLTPAEDSEFTRHVQTCPACERALAALVLSARTNTRSREPLPPELLDRLQRLWSAPTGPADLMAPASWPNIEGFEILDVLGRGGAGVVYRARDLGLGREVAVKMLGAGVWASTQDARRLLQDASTASKLRHPHIVPVYDVGQYGGLPFFVMELIPGGSLAQKLPALVHDPRAVARLVAQAAHALDYAHHTGICHRDVKPANILLQIRYPLGSRGERPPQISHAPSSPVLEDFDACVTDFGLAKRSHADAGLTLDGTVVGTPGYMAPEQIRSETPSPAADVYGLGVVLYECMTGQLPFRGTTPFDTLLLTLQSDAVRPRLLNRRLPRDLETICLKAPEKDPSRRYASAADLADDLERWLRGETVRARRVGAIGRGWRWCRRNPVVAVLGAALVLSVSCGLVVSVWMWQQAVESGTQARSSLRKEEEAHREAEEQYAMLRTTMHSNILNSSTSVFINTQTNPVRQAMLHEAESALRRLLVRRPEDPQLQAMLAKVLTQSGTIYYAQQQNTECVAAFEAAVGLWERLRNTEPETPQNGGWRAIAYICLEQAYEREGRRDQAQRCFEVAVRIWQGLIQVDPDEMGYGILFPAAVDMRWLLTGAAYVEAEIPRRFQRIRERLDRMGGGDEGVLFYGLLRQAYLLPHAELCLRTGQQEGVLTAAREAAAILADALPRASLHPRYRLYSVHHSVRVCLWLRRANVPDEALRLSELANRTVQDLVRASPGDPVLLALLSESWHAIGKIHWELHHAEESLTASRNAIDAQRRLSARAPTAEHTLNLGRRYLQLGRKLCELGRIDEAEVWFTNRQALWPGDSDKHEEALRELRKWAGEAGEDKNGLRPEARLDRQRYLELCSRLERKGVTATSTSGVKP